MQEQLNHVVRIGSGFYSARGGYAGRVVSSSAAATRFTESEAAMVARNITFGSRRISAERIETINQEI